MMENKKVLVADKIMTNGVLTIDVDTRDLTFGVLKNIVPNDKQNRTVLYEKWTDEATGITFQLTGYMVNKTFCEKEIEHKKGEARRMAEENEKLKMENAQFHTLLMDPEIQAYIKAKMQENK